MIKYKNVFEQLKEAGYNSTRIRNEKIFGERTLQNMRDGKMVSLETINTICTLTNKRIEDIIEFVPEFYIQVKNALKQCEEKILDEYTPEQYDVFNDQIKIPTEIYYKKMKEYMENMGFFEEDLLKCPSDKVNIKHIENVAAGREINKIFIPYLI